MLRDELEEFNIFALREYARRTGVASPTSKRKDVLISEIMDILDGKKAPNLSNKFGRPPKEFKADVFGVRSQYNGRPVFNQDSQSFDYSVFKDNKVNGYLEQNNNNFLLNIFTDGKVLTHFLPYEISNKYDFRTGDEISAVLTMKGGNMVVDEILSINGDTPDRFNNLRPSFSNMKHQFSKAVILNYNKGLSVHPGDIVYIKGESNINNSVRLVDMLNKSNNTRCVYINISLLEKTKNLLEQLNSAEAFAANLTDSEEYITRVVTFAIEHIERLAESGYNVLVAVDDLASIEKLGDGQLSKQILSMAKNAIEGGSVSVIAIVPVDNSLSKYDKLCDSVYISE